MIAKRDMVPGRNPELVWRPVEGELLIIHPDGPYWVLNGVGSFVWQAMDGSRTVAALASLVAAEYEVSVAQAETDIFGFLDQLDEGLVTWGTG